MSEQMYDLAQSVTVTHPRFRFSPYQVYGEFLGIADGAPGIIETDWKRHTGVGVLMDDGRRFVLWAECIGPTAEGAD